MGLAIPELAIYEQHPYFFKESEIYYPEENGQPMAETDFHINIISYLRQALERFFADRTDVYVSGCIMFYYVEGAPNEVVSPDVMVCFGVPKGERRTYQSWNENDVMPSVIFEIASRKTWSKDRTEKRELYETLGVQEYFIFNPERPKRIPALIAHRLVKDKLEKIPVNEGRVFSQVLGLDVIDNGDSLRLYNSQTKEFLPTIEEIDQQRELLADENARLKAELERLRKQLQNSES